MNFGRVLTSLRRLFVRIMSRLKLGTWNAYCDVCAGKFKADQLKKRWDGFMVCDKDWETRHPQDFLRGVEETSNKLPWTRPIDVGALVPQNGVSLEPALNLVLNTGTYISYSFWPSGVARQFTGDTGTIESWYLPTTNNIGNNYYIRFTLVSQTENTTTYFQNIGFIPLSSLRTIAMSYDGVPPKLSQAVFKVDIAVDPNGNSIMATKEITLQLDTQ